MRAGTRYALYFVPEPGEPFARMGSAILGADSETGEQLRQPSLKGCTACRLLEITREPAKYGLHATLKAPFYLAGGYSEDDLLRLAREFAARHAAFAIARLRVASLGSFLAAVPDNQCAGVPEQIRKLDALAADALSFFDHLRLEPSAEELEKRNSRSLSQRQQEYLQQWGYPYVLQDYRFHITLTGRLRNREESRKMKRILSVYLEDALHHPLRVRSLCVCKQNVTEAGGGNFRLLKRLHFSATPHQDPVYRQPDAFRAGESARD